MEVDDLFPIVEAGVLLGFAELKEGDVNITPEGKAWAEAGIEDQKRMFRDAALARILLALALLTLVLAYRIGRRFAGPTAAFAASRATFRGGTASVAGFTIGVSAAAVF